MNAVWQHPPFVIISTQPQLVLLVRYHLIANHTKAPVLCPINAAVEGRFETLPGDFVLFLRHAFGAELLFFAVDKVTFRA